MTTMRTLWTAGLAAGLLATTAAAQAPYPAAAGFSDARSVASAEVFVEPLAPYGTWLDTRWGRAWRPTVDRDWRPYTLGRWEDGPDGRTWRSDEPFGWAVYHYGRWGFDPALGWVWVPGTDWSPGWVAWRDSVADGGDGGNDGSEIVGWAPLPPQIVIGFGTYAAFDAWGYDQWYAPAWVYAPRRAVYGRDLRGFILPPQRGRDYWNATRGFTRYDRVDGRIVNHFGDRDRRRGDAGGRPAAGGDPRRDGYRYGGNGNDQPWARAPGGSGGPSGGGRWSGWGSGGDPRDGSFRGDGARSGEAAPDRRNDRQPDGGGRRDRAAVPGAVAPSVTGGSGAPPVAAGGAPEPRPAWQGWAPPVAASRAPEPRPAWQGWAGGGRGGGGREVPAGGGERSERARPEGLSGLGMRGTPDHRALVPSAAAAPVAVPTRAAPPMVAMPAPRPMPAMAPPPRPEPAQRPVPRPAKLPTEEGRE